MLRGRLMSYSVWLFFLFSVDVRTFCFGFSLGGAGFVPRRKFIGTAATSFHGFKRRKDASKLNMVAKEGSSKLSIHDLIAKYELGRQFERYRFLQKVMDNEVEDIDDVNQLLLHILSKRTYFKCRDEATFLPLLPPSGARGEYELLDELEMLLPTMEDDEESHKSMWDILMELHGREAVKMSKDQDEDWDARCLVVRLLIDQNFIVEDIPL